MAKYDVTYSCGHSGTAELYGPGKERDRKIEWMGRSGLCPECCKTKKLEEEKAQGPLFFVRRTQFGVEFCCYQNSYDIKDSLKARGYRFGEVYKPHADFLTMASIRSVKGWTLMLKAEGEDLITKVLAEAKWISDQGWKVTVQGPVEAMFASVIEGRSDLLPNRSVAN
jgi:hypothetical protein